jgi:DNA-binding NarL/FixJ family response regulator
MSRKIRIVIADDHPVFAQGLRQVLIADPYMDVVADARDGEAALQCIQEHKPDVAVLDVDMPKKDGFEVLRAVQERKLAVATIFLTMHKHESIFNAALDLGVQGYVLKDAALAEVVESVKAVAAGRNFVSPTLSTYLFGRRRRAQSLLEQQPALKDLSPSEQRVLRSIADAKTSDQIASELHVSIRTIEHHRANICAKLSLHGSNALLRFALAHKSELL